MADTFPMDPAHTAVLSMDCQAGIVSIYTREAKDAFLVRVAGVLNHARATGMTIIHIQVGFRPGLPEISSRNALFGAIKSSEQHQRLFREPLGAIPDVIAPQDNDIVITKHRISAFAGTDLDMILRANDIDTLVLYGIATSGVVLSTLIEAADADYRLAVIADCCADLDSALHDCLIQRFFPARGRSCRLRVLSAPHRGRINNRETFTRALDFEPRFVSIPSIVSRSADQSAQNETTCQTLRKKPAKLIHPNCYTENRDQTSSKRTGHKSHRIGGFLHSSETLRAARFAANRL